MNHTADVCVVGGGPAGATVAARLADLGYDVTLLEALPFPRPHVGEALPPTILPLLEVLHVRDEVEAAGFVRQGGSLIRWAGEVRQRPPSETEPGFQVDRGRFDALLLERAARGGVRVVHRARARSVSRDGSGRWDVLVQSPAGNFSLEANVLVDACGRASLLGGRRRRLAPPVLALYGYWRDVAWETPRTLIDVAREQWYWAGPVPDGMVNATVFAAPERVREVGANEAGYRRLLAQSPLLAACLEGTLIGGVRVCSAVPLVAEEPAGDDWLKVGEAAFTLDPLSSHGVQTAMVSALQAAVVIHTIRTAPERARAARTFYRERVHEVAAQHDELAAAHYRRQADDCPSPFWRARAKPPRMSAATLPVDSPRPGPNDRIELHPDARVGEMSVLEDDLIRSAVGIHPPGGGPPVAFLGGLPVERLLALVDGRRTLGDIAIHLAGQCGSTRAAHVLRWLVESRVARSVAVTSREGSRAIVSG